MFEYKTYLGILAVLLIFVAYVPYFINIFRNKTKPHAFSWLVWGILTGVVFAAQVEQKAGAGSWALGISTAGCFVIFIIALIKGDRQFVLLDWVSLAAALGIIVVWYFMKDPTLSVILAVLIDLFAFVPTYRKSYSKPFDETLWTYAISAIKFIIILLALEVYTLSTWLYPAYLVLANAGFVALLIIRRNNLKNKKS